MISPVIGSALLAELLGLWTISAMFSAQRTLETGWIGTVTFILVTTLSAIVFSWGGMTTIGARVALCLGLGAAIWIARRKLFEDRHHELQLEDHWFWNWSAVICFCLFSLRSFLWLIFLKGDRIAVLSQNNLGDLPLHIQYIRFFSQGASLWPVNPFHAHSTIGYPFGMDYFNAVLDRAGFSLWPTLIGIGLLGSSITGIALFRWGGAFAVAGFLFNGGTAGLEMFASGKWEDFQRFVDWKSIPLALFVTQRGFLYALPAGLLLLTHWRRMHSREDRPTISLPFSLELLVYSTMPLFHVHTFLFLSLVAGWLGIFGKNRGRLWLLIGAALVPASGWMFLLTDGFHAGNSLGWFPGWLQGPHFSWLYWLRNFGILPFCIVGLIYALVRQKKSVGEEARKEAAASLIFVWPAVIMLGATIYIKFSPWAWDNTKLMMWSYLVLLPFLWKVLVDRTPPVVRAAVCFLLFASGFISLWTALGKDPNGFEIAEQPVVLAVGRSVEQIPVEQAFASAPDYAHPLVFNGRRLALGYHGHMFGHGIPYQSEKTAMNLLMNGDPDWEKAAAFLGVSYIFWGSGEEKSWPASKKPWIAKSTVVTQEPWGTIYRLAR